MDKMKNARLPMILIGLVVLLVVPAIIFASNDGEEVIDVEKNVKIPPIDLEKPALTETATFALG